MHNEKVQWLIRTNQGRELGPFNTSTVLRLIRQGELDGTEKIKSLPSGKWIAISRDPDFYDELLKTIEGTSKEAASDSEVKKPWEEETNIQTIPFEGAKASKNEAEKTKVIANNQPSFSYNPPTYLKTDSFEEPIQKPKKRKVKKKNNSIFLSLLFFSFCALLAWYFIADEDLENSKNGIYLKVPSKMSSSQIGPKEVSQRLKSIVGLFENSGLSELVRAQDGLIELLEGASLNSDVRGFLCLVHNELSDYVTVDSKTLNLVTQFAQRTKSIDPSGINSIYCEINRLLLVGESKQVRSLLDQSLSQARFSEAAVLMYFKAQFLAEDFQTKDAKAYSQQAIKLWPSWRQAQFQLIELSIDVKDFNLAGNILEKIVTETPKDLRTNLLLAKLYYRMGNKKADAMKIYQNYLTSSAKPVRPELLAESYFTYASLLLEKGDKQLAKANLEKAIKLNPSNRKALQIWVELGGNSKTVLQGSRESSLLKTGERYFQNENFLAAQAEFKTAFEINPKNAIAAVKASQSLWNIGQRLEALEWGAKAVTADAKLPMAYYNLAKLHADQYDFKSAAKVLINGSKNLGQHPEVLRAYGYVEAKRNNFQFAKDYYDRALKQNEADVELLIDSAKVDRKSNNLVEAQKKIIRAIELESLNTNAQIEYLTILFKLKGANEALLYVSDLIQKYPSMREYRRALADIQISADRFIEAQNVLEKLIEVEPQYRKNYINLGLALQGQGKYRQAFKSFLQAAVLDPADAEPLMFAGLVNLQMNQPASAITQFQRAFNVNPDYPQANYFLAKAYFLSGESEKAISLLGEEKRKNPMIVDSYLLAAEIYSAKSEFVKCIQEYQQALKIKSLGADTYVKTARCYRQSGNPDVAENMLSIAAGLESGYPDIFREQGALFQQKGDKRAAIQAFNKYLELSPNAPDRQEILQLINTLAQ